MRKKRKMTSVRKKKIIFKLKDLCCEIARIIRQYPTGFVWIALGILFFIKKDTEEWFPGIFYNLLMLLAVLEANWGYIFFGYRLNELGRITDKQNWIALRDDFSSPLYAKGCFRKNYNRHRESKMSKLKGFYFCQIIAVILIVVIVIRIIYISVVLAQLKKLGIIYYVLYPELLIFIAVVVNSLLHLSFQMYYDSIIKNTKKKNQGSFYKERTVCKNGIHNDNYRVFSYKTTMKYEKLFYEMETAFQNKFNGMDPVFWGASGNMKDNLVMDAEEDRENNTLQILVQMYQYRLKKEHVDIMNQYIPKNIKKAARFQLPFGFPYVTYIIYVEERSDVFEDIFCGEIRQRKNFYCLPIGVVLKEEKMYIPGMHEGYGYTEYRQMKQTIFEIFRLIDSRNSKVIVPYSQQERKPYKEVRENVISFMNIVEECGKRDIWEDDESRD